MFYFVFNTNQMRDFIEIENIIKKSVQNYEIIGVKPHDYGPVYSALQIENINN